MRVHTCILKGPIPFMTHSSLLISNVNCWSGILPNQKLLGRDSSQKTCTKANTSRRPKLQSASIPSKCRSTVSSLKRSILKSHHLKISAVRLFLRNFFLSPQDAKIFQKLPPKKKKLRQNRGVPGPIGLQPACGSQRCQPARTRHFDAHTRLIEMTSGLYDEYIAIEWRRHGGE